MRSIVVARTAGFEIGFCSKGWEWPEY